jgi:phage shock protein A
VGLLRQSDKKEWVRVAMKAFSDGKLTDRQIPRRNTQPVHEKASEGIELLPWNSEELHQTQALIQDLDKQFAGLRETLQRRQTRIDQVNRRLSALQILVFPLRRPWWRRWFPW